MDDLNFAQMITEARQRYQIETAIAPKARTAQYQESDRCFDITLINGLNFNIPVDLIKWFKDQPDDLLSEIQISVNGRDLHWETLDIDFHLIDLLNVAISQSI